MVLGDPNGVTESLIMHQLTLSKELDGIPHVGIVGQAQDVVVGRSRFLLCYYHVFATKLSLAKARKILILQGVTALWG